MSANLYLSLAKVEFEYAATTEDELTVSEDQLVWVLEDDDPEWFKVKIKSVDSSSAAQVGLVPASYLTTPDTLKTVTALFDYAPARDEHGQLENDEELEIVEGETLALYEDEGDWVLVGREGGRGVGFVPGTYVEAAGEGAEAEAEPEAAEDELENEPVSSPVEAYVDPNERVAQSKAVAKAGDVKTWSVTEVDKKKKKKKGTLGVGNGAVFFASESDKTPVQQFALSTLTDLTTEKSKHLHLTFPASGELHYVIPDKSTFDEIMAKIDLGRGDSGASAAAPTAPSPPPVAAAAAYVPPPPPPPPVAAPRTADTTPLPPPPIRTASSYTSAAPPKVSAVKANGTSNGTSNGNGVALYDFEPQGADELALAEGDRIIIIKGGSDDPDWTKIRKVGSTEEGVVPASYVELDAGAEEDDSAGGDDGAAEAARLEEEQAAADEARLKAQLQRDARAAAARQAQAQADKEERDRSKRASRQPPAAPIPVPRASEDGPALPDRPKSSASKSGSGSAKPSKKPDAGRIKTWKDRTGQFKVEAEFLGMNGNKIRLHKLNGVIIEVPIEKMSNEDQSWLKRHLSGASRSNSDDNVPLGEKVESSRRQRERESRDKSSSSAQRDRAARPPPIKAPGRQVDWFEFFLNAGCGPDDCARYERNVQREQIEDSLIPDLEDSNLRALGLKEGDIIRVKKFIRDKFAPPTPTKTDREVQIAADALLAQKLSSAPSAPAPNLFAAPDGTLKPRRGRRNTVNRQDSAVNSSTLASAASELSRTNTPPVNGSGIDRTASPAPASSLDPSRRSSSTTPQVGGFDDDAWTVKSPAKAAAPPAAPAPPPAPPAPAAPPAAPEPTPAPAAAPARSPSVDPATAGLTYNDGLLAGMGIAARSPSAPIPSQPTGQANLIRPSMTGGSSFSSGMPGMSPGLNPQMTGFNPNGPRGPIAPVAANQSLLAPLVPTQTGFQRPQSAFGQGMMGQPTGMMPQMTGYQPQMQPMMTGFPGMQPQQPFAQPMGMQPTGFQPQQTGFAPQQTAFQPQQTGYPGQFSQPQQQGGAFSQAPNAPVQFNPLPPQQTQSPSPAPNAGGFKPSDIFSSMKDGTFAAGSTQLGPQGADKYDALRPQQTGFQPQFQQQQQTGFFPAQQQFGNGMMPQQTGFMQQGFPGQQQMGYGAYQQRQF